MTNGVSPNAPKKGTPRDVTFWAFLLLNAAMITMLFQTNSREAQGQGFSYILILGMISYLLFAVSWDRAASTRFITICLGILLALVQFTWHLYFIRPLQGVLSTVSLVVSGIIVVMAVCLVWIRLGNMSFHNLEVLKQDLSEFRFGGVMAALTLFLCATYFITFALAFHDQALRAENKQGLLFPEDRDRPPTIKEAAYVKKTPAVGNDGQGAAGASADTGAGAGADAEKLFNKNYRLTFEEGSSLLMCDHETVRKLAAGGDAESLDGEPKKNAYCVAHIVKRIQECGRYGRALVIISSKATHKTIRSESTSMAYPSNYHLSEARAVRVQQKILELLYCGTRKADGECERLSLKDLKPAEKQVVPQIEWVIIPYSWEYNPKDVSSKNSNGQPPTGAGGHEAPWVEVAIIPARDNLRTLISDLAEAGSKEADEVSSPAGSGDAAGDQDQPAQIRHNPVLMDYLYFTIYTITTTGYGDIMPKSHWAKLIVSLANIYELIFGVVFFNVLLMGKEAETKGN